MSEDGIGDDRTGDDGIGGDDNASGHGAVGEGTPPPAPLPADPEAFADALMARIAQPLDIPAVFGEAWHAHAQDEPVTVRMTRAGWNAQHEAIAQLQHAMMANTRLCLALLRQDREAADRHMQDFADLMMLSTNANNEFMALLMLDDLSPEERRAAAAALGDAADA